MLKTKSSAVLSLVLVFLSGILVGSVSYRLYAVNTVSTATGGRPATRPDPEEIRKRRIKEMQDRIKLDGDQLAKLNTIYDHTFQEFQSLKKKGDEEGHQIWEKQRESVRAMLRPDQLPLYEQFQKEQDEQRKKRRQAEGKK
jgi:biopolymer transport protein ExbB/TolQ